jgi:hypothetical protein
MEEVDMKQMISVMVAIFILLPGYLFAQEQVDAPNFKNGDFWDFNVSGKMVTSSSSFLGGVYEILFNDGKLQIFKVEQNEKSPVESSAVITISILQAMLGRGNYLGGEYLQFPLSVGKKWNIEYTIRPTGAKKDVSYKGETTVSGFESASSPAGNFRVLKLTRQVRSSIGTNTTATYYYGPEAKSVVKFLLDSPDGTRNVELVKFGAGQ